MVVADTSVWISFFNRPSSIEKQALDDLLDRDEVVLIGVVLTELVQSVRSPIQRETLRNALLALPYLEVTFDTWIAAGDLSSALLRKGITIPVPDLLIASMALEHSCSVNSLDTDFQRIPGLSFFSPASS